MGRVCSEADTHTDSTICISAALTERIQNIPDVDILRDMVIPALLQTVVKGFNLNCCIIYFISFYIHVYFCYSAIGPLLSILFLKLDESYVDVVETVCGMP